MLKLLKKKFSTKAVLPDLAYDYHELAPIISKN